MLRLYKKLKFSQIEYNLNELRKSALNSYTDDREFVSTGNALKQEKDKYLRELPYIKRAFEEKDYPDVLNYLLEQLRAQGQEHANSSQFEYCESVRKKIREVSAMMPRTKKALTPLSSPHLGGYYCPCILNYVYVFLIILTLFSYSCAVLPDERGQHDNV